MSTGSPEPTGGAVSIGGGGDRPRPPGVPPLLGGLVDDAAVFPPGSASLPDAVGDHRIHRDAWYAPLVGPLLMPASTMSSGALVPLLTPGEVLAVGLIGDTGIERLPEAVESATAHRVAVRQLEAAVARRGEDPQPGVAAMVALAHRYHEIDLYAEIPLTWGLMGALDVLAEARAHGARIAAKFRTGGLAAELFPSAAELATVICACRDRDLSFKLTAGLHQAVRHHDPETGFTHHGFVNVLAAVVTAATGADAATVGQLLSATQPLSLLEMVRPHLVSDRPLWTGFGSCSVREPLADLRLLGLLGSS